MKKTALLILSTCLLGCIFENDAANKTTGNSVKNEVVGLTHNIGDRSLTPFYPIQIWITVTFKKDSTNYDFKKARFTHSENRFDWENEIGLDGAVFWSKVTPNTIVILVENISPNMPLGKYGLHLEGKRSYFDTTINLFVKNTMQHTGNFHTEIEGMTPSILKPPTISDLTFLPNDSVDVIFTYNDTLDVRAVQVVSITLGSDGLYRETDKSFFRKTINPGENSVRAYIGKSTHMMLLLFSHIENSIDDDYVAYSRIIPLTK